MWNPFEKARNAEKRAEEAEELLRKITNRLDKEAAVLKAEREKVDKIKRLAEEEQARKNAEKNIATEAGQPYIAVIKFDIDGKNITEGEIELDWNDLFVDRLKSQGYVGQSPEDIVDQWFQDVCRHIALETFEQADADISLTRKPTRKDLGSGTAEYT